MKLQVKIQIFTSLLMFILLLLVNVAIFLMFHKMSTSSELEELELTTNDLVATLKENPDADVSNVLKAYLPVNGMIRIIEESGNPLFEQTRSTEYLTLPWKFTNKESKEIYTEGNYPDVAVVTKPIIWQDGEIVTLQVSNVLYALDETMRTLSYVLTVLFLIMLIPVIISGVLLSRLLLRPIQKLQETMQENMKHGKWKKIDTVSRSKDEIYEMEKTFNQMIDYLKDSYERQEMFVSDASHELKTPVQIIKSYAQLLKRRGMNDPALLKESVEAIDSEADRMKRLIEQMLSLAKGKQEVVDKDPIDIEALIKEIIPVFEGAYGRKIHLQSEPVFVKGNKGLLEQVLYILLENGMKYSSDDMEVNISKRGEKARISVTDFGQGIPKDVQERIFDRFYRVDKARSRETGGTGLGLAIAASIVKGHKGKIEVESELGKGSTFTIILPYVQ